MSKQHTLLIVDDEPVLREMLSMLFERDGYKVFQAGNGRDAFEIVKSENIDLVISDIRMPGGNGVELLENVRKQHYEIPVVLFITGFADISVEEAFDKGAEAIFGKPFDRKLLFKTVREALAPKDDRWKSRSWRGETALPVEFSLQGFESARVGKVLNIGRGGIFIAMENDLPKVDDKMSFRIRFSEGSILDIEGYGIVKWVRRAENGEYPAGCGIEFSELSEQSRAKILELINFLKTKQYIPRV